MMVRSSRDVDVSASARRQKDRALGCLADGVPMIEIACDIRVRTATSLKVFTGEIDRLGNEVSFWLRRDLVQIRKDGAVLVNADHARYRGLI